LGFKLVIFGPICCPLSGGNYSRKWLEMEGKSGCGLGDFLGEVRVPRMAARPAKIVAGPMLGPYRIAKQRHASG
jgi:hypothetical protein